MQKKKEPGGESICSNVQCSLSDPIWDYFWTGINRSFDYEPGFAQKNVTNTTKCS